MICALAFVLANDVQNTFDELPALIRDQYGNGGNGVLCYFKNNYVGRICFSTPKGITTFPINFYNMFQRADDKLPRTINAVEGWHRMFQAHVSACHPVFWKFLEVLQKEETVVIV